MLQIHIPPELPDAKTSVAASISIVATTYDVTAMVTTIVSAITTTCAPITIIMDIAAANAAPTTTNMSNTAVVVVAGIKPCTLLTAVMFGSYQSKLQQLGRTWEMMHAKLNKEK